MIALNCPFCGSLKGYFSNAAVAWACSGCGAQGPSVKPPFVNGGATVDIDAASLWNGRSDAALERQRHRADNLVQKLDAAERRERDLGREVARLRRQIGPKAAA